MNLFIETGFSPDIEEGVKDSDFNALGLAIKSLNNRFYYSRAYNNIDINADSYFTDGGIPLNLPAQSAIVLRDARFNFFPEAYFRLTCARNPFSTRFVSDSGFAHLKDVLIYVNETDSPMFTSVFMGVQNVDQSYQRTLTEGTTSCTLETVNRVQPVRYIDSIGGTVSGNQVQTVEVGETSTEVTAVADEGYEFEKWSDGVATAARADYVTGPVIVKPIFQTI